MRRRYDFSYDDSYEAELNDLPHNMRTSIHSVTFIAGIFVLIYLSGLFYLANVVDNTLPTPLYLDDEEQHPNSFISERAFKHIKYLTSLGPRVAGGYENEVLTVNYLVGEINSIITQANEEQHIEYDVQIVNGSFVLSRKPLSLILSYSSVKNLVVKLHGNKRSNNSLLVNAHFDSVPTSPGGSDDGINCAAMLEIIYKLSQSDVRFDNDVIFLFNGAEETPLQASHGFITEHKWAKNCKVVINLEAAGAGGKIVLFQTGPKVPWLVNYYQMVPHPCGQVAGEEIFQSGIIPSDTDFRIFRDFGKLVGMDMAFVKDGYRYHTKYDGLDNIPLGSLQHVGDNTMSLILNIGNSKELTTDGNIEDENVVYFDVFGQFVVVYSLSAASIINSAVSVLSILVLLFNLNEMNLRYNLRTCKYVVLTLLVIISGWVITAGSVYGLALIVDKLNLSMSWYGHPWLIFGLYVTPTIAITSYSMLLVNHENLSVNVRSYVQANLVRLIWTIVLIVGTILKIRSSYAVLVLVLFHVIAFITVSVFQLQHSKWKWQLTYIFLLFVPTFLLMCQTNLTLSLFIPITGRIGSNKNPEVIIGLISTFFTILITSPYVALVTLLKKSKLFFIFLGIVFVSTIIILVTPLGFPYSGDPNSPTPQRQWILHTSRTFYTENNTVLKKDAGILFVNMDRNSPRILKPYIKDLEKAKPLECSQYVLCGLPLPHPKIIEIMEWSTWIPANQPKFNKELYVNFTSSISENSPKTRINYEIVLEGPDRLFVYILPRNVSEIKAISLVGDVPSPNLYFNGRPIYSIMHTFAEDDGRFTFNLDVETSAPNDDIPKLLDVVVTGIYVHERKNPKTPYFLDIIKQFPEWADVTPMMGVYQSFSL